MWPFKTYANVFLKMFAPYEKFRIDFHKKYGGTYMLFGFNEKQVRWLLLDQTFFPTVAQDWADNLGTLMPPENE